MNNPLMSMPKPAVADKPNVGGPLRLGTFVAVVFVFGAIAWAAYAPLESAAVAPGTIVVDGNRKSIQHLEGGLVDTIHVRDGDSVEAGQILITLDDTTARATLELLLSRRLVTSALTARLQAERDGSEQIVFPDWMNAVSDNAKIAEIMNSQRTILAARSQSRLGQSSILNQRIREFGEEISGLSDQIISENRQLELVADEIGVVDKLLDEGLARKPRLLKLQREFAQLEGTRNMHRAQIARVKQSISETQMRINSLQTELVNEAVQEMRSTQADLYDVNERIRAASDVLKRIEIAAPLSGKIVGLSVYTRGGVVMPGQVLMDIVPLTAKLVVDAKIEPKDIDVVEEGLEAEVRLTALKQRGLLPLKGRVVDVSADQLIDDATQQSYYLARIELDIGFKLPEGIIMKPGMQTEVMIKTGERSALTYALEPLTDSFNRAFRED